MTSQTGQQIITVNTILPTISRSKGNQTLKFGWLIECNMIFFRYHTENEPGTLVLDPFLFF